MKDRIDLDTRQLALELIDARLVCHLTQADLAKKAGVNQNYISNLESGLANPTVGSFNKIVSILGKRLKLVDNK